MRVLSPLFFAVFFDDSSVELNNIKVGCYFAVVLLNHVMFAGCICVLGEEDRCFHVSLPVAAFLEILYQTCHHESNHCYSRWMCSAWDGSNKAWDGSNKAWDGSNNALLRARQQKCCRRPTTQRTPAEHRGAHWQQDLCHWAASLKNMAFIIVLQETHCTTADKLVIPKFSPGGSILSKNHGLVMFVHERLEWSLVDQSPDQSET